MTAYDGLPFSIFITLQDLRKSLTALRHTLPKSAISIREQVMKYGLHVTERIKHDIILKKSIGEKFSITFDEWTSMRNRRYLNLNIHGVGYFWNLGLVRIQGSFSAEKCIEKISSKLKDFELDLQSDIIAITTDGEESWTIITNNSSMVLRPWPSAGNPWYILSEINHTI